MRSKWGQNFLADDGVARRIVQALGAGPSGWSSSLEIGPGPGGPHAFLVGTTKALTAVELDRRLAEDLRAGGVPSPGATVVQADFLDRPLAEGAEAAFYAIGNLPYSAAGPDLAKAAGLARMVGGGRHGPTGSRAFGMPYGLQWLPAISMWPVAWSSATPLKTYVSSPSPIDPIALVKLSDLRTAFHYEQSADLVLDTVRTLTEVDDTRLIGSVSGGRKPLAPLLAGALGFLGRPQDRIVHVLVNEPFDNPTLRPPLYFPAQAQSKHHYFDANAGKELMISSSAAKLELVDVPFVRLRRLFSAEPQLYRSRYSVLARAYADRISEITGPIELSFDDARGVLAVNGHPVQLRGREHPFFAFLYDRWKQGTLPYVGHDRAYPHLLAFLGRWKAAHPDRHFERDDEDWLISPRLDDIARQLAALRTRLAEAGMENAAKRLLPTHGPVGLPLPPETSLAER